MATPARMRAEISIGKDVQKASRKLEKEEEEGVSREDGMLFSTTGIVPQLDKFFDSQTITSCTVLKTDKNRSSEYLT